MRKKIGQRQAMILLLFSFLWIWGAVSANAEEMLQNTSFESYDPVTLVPDHWQVLDGNVEIYADQAYDGAVSVYSLGGTYIDEVDTPNPPRTGTLVQLVDLSVHPDWSNTNWFSVILRLAYRKWGVDRSCVYLEFLPTSYNTTTVTADDVAWNGPDVQQVWYYFSPSQHAKPEKPWYTGNTVNHQMPSIRWVRLRIEFEVAYLSNSNFEDGPYYLAVDAVSLDLTAIEPEDPCTANLLTNPGFEIASDGMPDGWQVLDGNMDALDGFDTGITAYTGNAYAGNIGGYITEDQEGNPIDYPNPVQDGGVVQVVDLSTLAGWEEAGGVAFRFSGYQMNYVVSQMRARVQYLPESYNDISQVNGDDPAWENDALTALSMGFNSASKRWKKFETGWGSLSKVRWVRVRLGVDDGSVDVAYWAGEPVPVTHRGPYLGGFDQVCLEAESLVAGDLIQNASFEEADETMQLAAWHSDPADGTYQSMTDPPVPAGSRWLAKFGTGEETAIRFYQVVDMADKIPFWQAINPYTGAATEFNFIQLALGAYITNHGGAGVKVGLEYLPYGYNDVDGITWDHAAWQPRQWVSDGAAFTNSGGDAINLGTLIEDTAVDPSWREVTFDGWLPRVRWLRLRIELDATPGGEGQPVVGIDDLSISAICRQYGPYSGFGNLPEADYPGLPGAPDLGIPGWTGPEGDGISGGYTGQSQGNYVNPAFAGFADAVAGYSPSGQHNYNVNFQDPMSITGRPYNDAGWVYQIVTLGDMDLAMLADYFGPAPSGDGHPGEVTAGFDKCPIINGPGHDFATFENGFVQGWTGPLIFGELAFVEVSSNGTDFARFPTHSLTPKWPGSYGCFIASGVFGLTGKHVNAYGDQWGTPFDLEWLADDPKVLDGTVNLNDIRYVRQVDIPGGGPRDASADYTDDPDDVGYYTGLFYDSHGNPIFDSWVTWGSGGVDLDAIGVLNTSAADSDGDYIVDYWDNCPATSNEKQYDTDGDGYGNTCDCDIDGDVGGDGSVDLADYLVFKAAYGGTGPILIPGAPGEDNTYADASENWNADADFNGDLTVDLADYLIFKARYGSTAAYSESVAVDATRKTGARTSNLE